MYMNIYVYIVRPMFIALPADSKAVTKGKGNSSANTTARLLPLARWFPMQLVLQADD